VASEASAATLVDANVLIDVFAEDPTIATDRAGSG